MRIVLAAVGRLRAGPMRETFDDYAGRLRTPLKLAEVEERRRLPAEVLKRREAELLRGAIPKGAMIVALDEAGTALTSAQFARKLGDWRDSGPADLAFVIGGADGLDASLVREAAFVLSLGAMTWPHVQARIMLAEQLYRAETILAGHPYHRA